MEIISSPLYSELNSSKATKMKLFIIFPLLFTAILGKELATTYVKLDLKNTFLSLYVIGDSTIEYIYANVPLPDGRIVGGDLVSIEDYPYQVSVQLLGSHYCGGAIISDRYILSAAHCFA